MAARWWIKRKHYFDPVVNPTFGPKCFEEPRTQKDTGDEEVITT